MNSNVVFQIRSLLQSGQNILIALSENADEETMAAGLALYLVFSKMRKQTSIISSSDVKVGQAYLFGVDKIAKNIAGSDALVVSFPYKEGTIEKVTYNIEQEKFNLVIEPRGDGLQFKPEDIEYTMGKGEFDVIFVLGARELSDLGALYTNHRSLFSQKSVINIDNHQDNAGFGGVQLIANMPISQSVATLLRLLRIPIDQDAASNLYTGIIASGSDIAIDKASADALEAIAYLVRSKAQNLKKAGNTTQPVKTTQTSFSKQPTAIMEEAPAIDSEETPDDWLKPKIFSTRNN